MRRDEHVFDQALTDASVARTFKKTVSKKYMLAVILSKGQNMLAKMISMRSLYECNLDKKGLDLLAIFIMDQINMNRKFGSARLHSHKVIIVSIIFIIFDLYNVICCNHIWAI